MSGEIGKYLVMAAGMGIAIGVMFLLDHWAAQNREAPLRANARDARSHSKAADLQEEEEEEESLGEWISKNERAKSEEVEELAPLPEMVCCKICLNNRRRVSHVFACGHATCLECAVMICKSNRGCPFDRKPITKPPTLFVFA